MDCVLILPSGKIKLVLTSVVVSERGERPQMVEGVGARDGVGRGAQRGGGRGRGRSAAAALAPHEHQLHRAVAGERRFYGEIHCLNSIHTYIIIIRYKTYLS